MRKTNFSPGPAALPFEVLSQIESELYNWKNSGASVMEISHRSDKFLQLLEELRSNLRNIFNIPSEHKILLMSGGARGQFAAIPLNLSAATKEISRAIYLISGYWSAMAEKMARPITSTISMLYDDGQFLHMPKKYQGKIEDNNFYKQNYKERFNNPNGQIEKLGEDDFDDWQVKHGEQDYFHYCYNETIDGIMLPDIPRPGKIPLVADISSCIGSYPLDFSNFALAYACTQKNLGIAGLTVVSISEEILERKARLETPSILNYQVQNKNASIFNTPNTFAIYVCNLVCEWIKNKGGVSRLGQVNRTKAQTLYKAIDESDGFYVNNIATKYRSLTNVVFELSDKNMENEFILQATKHNFINLSGHKVLGGIRASIYNAISEEEVNQLCSFMQDFIKQNG